MAQAVLLVAAVASAAYSAHAQRQAGKEQERIAGRNAKLLEKQAEDAKKQGEEEARALRARTRRLQGRQRAAAAAQGIEVGVGTAADLVEETGVLGLEDEIRVRNNAAMQAWGFRTQASNSRFEGRALRKQANSQAVGTIMTGLGDGYREYSAWKG